jgi:hypothetical protein
MNNVTGVSIHNTERKYLHPEDGGSILPVSKPRRQFNLHHHGNLKSQMHLFLRFEVFTDVNLLGS